MVQVIERPIGRKVDSSASVTIYNSSGKAGFTDSLSLSTGDYIYIQSNIEDYNGFWYIEKSGGVTYFKQNPQDSRVSFVVEANATVYSTIQVDWSCVHLPIVYKLKSDFYPTNTNDPIVTITPYGFVNGYFAVQHSALTGSDALLELDYVSLDDGSDTPVILRVVEVVSTTLTVLDFDGTTPGGSLISIQRYRNNYHVIVNLYAGLNASHTWASKKPYELAATLKYIPDENNEVVFSVSEILKSYIEIRNNTLLGTLPNNIDFFTQFYITFQEAYDVSEFPYDVQISVHETDPVNDQGNFEGVAANSILEFKNRYSGYLSEYVIDSDLIGSKFLTLFERPTIFQDKYFDISFIKGDGSNLTISKTWVFSNGSYVTTEPIVDYDGGIYRINISASCEDYTNTTYEEDIISIDEFASSMDGWVSGSFVQSSDNGGCLKVTTTGSPVADAIKSTISSPMEPFKIRIKWSSSAGSKTLRLTLFDVSTSNLQQQSFVGGGGLNTSIMDITSPSVYNAVTQYYTEIIGSGASSIIRVNSVETYKDVAIINILTGISYVDIEILDGSTVLSEVKSIDIDCNCYKQELYLTWLNNLGGFDYWNFTDGSDYTRNIIDSGETKTNIFPDWPKSYGENASVIRKQTFRTSNKGILVRAQHLTLEELQAIEYLKSSILVEIMLSRSDKRRVIVDTNSWVSYKDVDKLYTLSFTLEYTNDIPVQRL